MSRETDPAWDAFYIGYRERAPEALAPFLKRVAFGVAAVFAIVAAVLAIAQRPLPEGTFEFGTRRELTGVLHETPVPTLVLDEAIPATDAGSPPDVRTLILVGPGKSGLPEFARGAHGTRVRFRATLAYAGDLLAAEMNDPESFEILERGADVAPVPSGASVEHVGELVDTKCWSGVMRPASGKVHRACAVRCLAGGIPPGLRVEGTDGGVTVYLLDDAEGSGPAAIDPQWAGRRIRVIGDRVDRSDLPVIRVRRAELADHEGRPS